MINEYSLLWRRLVTLAASCWGRWRGPHSPHCSGVKPIGCVHKFHHIAEQNVIGSARIVCLCLLYGDKVSEIAHFYSLLVASVEKFFENLQIVQGLLFCVFVVEAFGKLFHLFIV